MLCKHAITQASKNFMHMAGERWQGRVRASFDRVRDVARTAERTIREKVHTLGRRAESSAVAFIDPDAASDPMRRRLVVNGLKWGTGAGIIVGGGPFVFAQAINTLRHRGETGQLPAGVEDMLTTLETQNSLFQTELLTVKLQEHSVYAAMHLLGKPYSTDEASLVGQVRAALFRNLQPDTNSVSTTNENPQPSDKVGVYVAAVKSAYEIAAAHGITVSQNADLKRNLRLVSYVLSNAYGLTETSGEPNIRAMNGLSVMFRLLEAADLAYYSFSSAGDLQTADKTLIEPGTHAALDAAITGAVYNVGFPQSEFTDVSKQTALVLLDRMLSVPLPQELQ